MKKILFSAMLSATLVAPYNADAMSLTNKASELGEKEASSAISKALELAKSGYKDMKKYMCRKGELTALKGSVCRSGKAELFDALSRIDKELGEALYYQCVLYCGNYDKLFESTLVKKAEKAGYPEPKKVKSGDLAKVMAHLSKKSAKKTVSYAKKLSSLSKSLFPKGSKVE